MCPHVHCSVIYSWPLNNMDLNYMGLLVITMHDFWWKMWNKFYIKIFSKGNIMLLILILCSEYSKNILNYLLALNFNNWYSWCVYISGQSMFHLQIATSVFWWPLCIFSSLWSLWFHYLFTFMQVHAPEQGHVHKSGNSERILEQMSNVHLQHMQ